MMLPPSTEFVSRATERLRCIAPRRLSDKQFILAVALLCVIAMLALLRANYNYVDDAGRIVHGYRGWDNFSRYTSYFLSVVLHANEILSDISPLPQLIAIGLMAISAYLFTKLVHQQERFSVCQIAAVAPLCLSPWFLECLSYKFDAPYMALSVLAALTPFIIRRANITQAVVSFGSALVVSTTYQVSYSVFMIAFILVIAHRWNKGESVLAILKNLSLLAISFAVGVLFFKLFVFHENVVNTYVGLTPSISLVPQNLSKFYATVRQDLTTWWQSLTAFVAFGFLFAYVRASTRPKLAALAIGIVTLCGFLLSSFGLYPLLEKPLFAPRACYGFGVTIAACSVYLCANKGNIILKIAPVLLAWSFFVFSFEYGNALYYQGKYTDFRVNLIINDLNNLNDFNNLPIVRLSTTGNIGRSPIIRKSIKRTPVLGRLVPSTLGHSKRWYNIYAFLHHYNLRSVKLIRDGGKGEEILKDNRYHTISKTGNRFFIHFKE